MDDFVRHRASRPVRQGRSRARELAIRLGRALREARRSAGMTQADLAGSARISQPRISELERGDGGSSSIETWAVVAAAAGEQLAAFIERASGASLPRDVEHLRRQELLLARASAGGWAARPEAPVLAGDRPRSVDVLLARRERREAAVVEIWDLFDDLGAALRGTDEKVRAVAAILPGWRVQACWVVRGTRRNRSLLRSLPGLVQARFPAAGAAWFGALTEVTKPMPLAPGLLWTDVRGLRLVASRWTVPGRRCETLSPGRATRPERSRGPPGGQARNAAAM